VTTATRSPALPDVPTMKEAGLDYEVPFWTAIYAPAQTPSAIIDKLASAIGKAMRSDEVAKRLAEVGTQRNVSTILRQSIVEFKLGILAFSAVG
jgi:tripartite-type tricarboxylate transporter receptor subunit TctC